MSVFQPAPAPPSDLGRYRKLAPSCGLHVSPLQLGGMSIGDRWSDYGMGTMSKDSSFHLLDTYYELGGNMIDTANYYQFEQSEEWIGEWSQLRGIRDQLVIATKYTTFFKTGDANVKQKVIYGGNNLKSLTVSVEASLKKLRTHYIDILYVHWWDYETPIREVMDGLHALVLQGKVLYLGISDTPAWVVAKANQYARDHGKTPFVIYSGLWNVLDRSFESDIIPMAREEGMALAPWNVLVEGKLRTDEEEALRRRTGENGRAMFDTKWERTETERQMCRILEKVAAEVGTKHITAVAIAYVMQKVPYVFPVVGGRKVEHFMANMDALKIVLTPEHITKIEAVVPFPPRFPQSVVGTGEAYTWPMISGSSFVKQPYEKPIVPKL